ncbi:MAG: hypothetical protein CM15mP40_11310 [Alphaproteobacteria bacterium]|nr:MAG: hypothetical protein CM15mP40_11310 [Alphaproteobacteria bacterium]
MEEILIIQTNIYPFNLLIVSMLIDPDFLKNIVNIARPIAASAAATTKINKANICPNKSSRVFENPTKFIFVAKSISSIDIKIDIIFFLFIKIPRKPIENIIEDKIK